MKCFYHGDADGRCAGFWVALSAGLTDRYADSSFIEITYGKPFPFETIRDHEQIYIVDYSIAPEEMERLLAITPDVTWIDHHKTAIERYDGFPYAIRGVRFDGIAGCMLTYCYLHHMTGRGAGEIKPFDVSMTANAPMFTKLIADWDVWKFDFGKATSEYITAFNAYDFAPESKLWDALLADNPDFAKPCVATLLKEGAVMLKYRDGWARDYMKLGFETMFEGHRCFAVNLGHCSSEFFKSLPDGKYDVFMPFAFNGEQYTVSLYSTSVDVSVIAKKYGGGGHKGASGFQCKELPFRKEETECT